MDVEPEEDPPIVVLVHGPRGVGKSTLIRALVKHYTHQSLGEVCVLTEKLSMEFFSTHWVTFCSKAVWMPGT